jgi:hypothetical protein
LIISGFPLPYKDIFMLLYEGRTASAKRLRARDDESVEFSFRCGGGAGQRG